MAARRSHPFLGGLLVGAALGLPLGVLLIRFPPATAVIDASSLPVDRLREASLWIESNLGLSPLAFGATLALFVLHLRRLGHQLDREGAAETIVQLEHLTDVWISLFFGIGVIWTAIGMRSALLYALGDPSSAAEAGAYVVLQRLVEGGILTALTTTILGGVGGYLMRVAKTLYLGTRLNRHYESREHRHAERTETLLTEIREVLTQTGQSHADPSPSPSQPG